MSDEASEVSTSGLVDTLRPTAPGRRKRWPEADKRQIVAETRMPGASVSVVARRHDVNANQLFKWRREMASKQLPAADKSIAMLPVEIAQPVEIAPERAGEPRARLRRSGVIEITFGSGARVCLRGEVSPETLRQVIELLR